jgi:hypothetical protein
MACLRLLWSKTSLTRSPRSFGRTQLRQGQTIGSASQLRSKVAAVRCPHGAEAVSMSLPLAPRDPRPTQSRPPLNALRGVRSAQRPGSAGTPPLGRSRSGAVSAALRSQCIRDPRSPHLALSRLCRRRRGRGSSSFRRRLHDASGCEAPRPSSVNGDDVPAPRPLTCGSLPLHDRHDVERLSLGNRRATLGAGEPSTQRNRDHPPMVDR